MTAMMEQEDYLAYEDEGEDYLGYEAEGDFVYHGEFEGEQEDFLSDLVRSALGAEVSGPLSEHDEMELAHQLLEVSSEEELDQFIGSLVKKAAGAVKNFARSSVGRAVGGAIKGLARKALPVVGGAVGSWIAPGVGTAIGSRLGSMAGRLFEMEGEIDQQELEFEMARHIVQIGATTARNASRVSPTSAPASEIARRALIAATRKHAPAALASPRRRAPGGYGGHRPGHPRRTHRRRGYGSSTVIHDPPEGHPGDADAHDDQGHPGDVDVAASHNGAGHGVRHARSPYPHNV